MFELSLLRKPLILFQDTRNPEKIYPWTNILIPGGLSSPNNTRTTSALVAAVPSHQASFLLNNLEDKSEYEVRIDK